MVQVANVKLSTSAKAMADGSQGELIEVQSLETRDRYLAHVTGIQEVAVYPRRVQIAAHPATSEPRAAKADSEVPPRQLPPQPLRIELDQDSRPSGAAPGSTTRNEPAADPAAVRPAGPSLADRDPLALKDRPR